jgi:hypothetical protein
MGHPIMPKGLKETSSLIEISFQTNESAPNTFTQERVDLQLNPLDNEVFIVYAANLDPFNPDAIAGVDTSVLASVSSTSQTTAANLGITNCIASANHSIRAGGFVDGGVGFMTRAGETPPTTLEYVAIIATNDFFVQVEGVGNLAAKAVSGRLYGVRARADASIYAALVQSEVLSS